MNRNKNKKIGKEPVKTSKKQDTSTLKKIASTAKKRSRITFPEIRDLG